MRNMLLKNGLILERAALERRLNGFAKRANIVAHEKKQWDNDPDVEGKIEAIQDVLFRTLVAPNEPSKECTDFKNIEINMADAIISILDLAYESGWNVPAALTARLLQQNERK